MLNTVIKYPDGEMEAIYLNVIPEENLLLNYKSKKDVFLLANFKSLLIDNKQIAYFDAVKPLVNSGDSLLLKHSEEEDDYNKYPNVMLDMKSKSPSSNFQITKYYEKISELYSRVYMKNSFYYIYDITTIRSGRNNILRVKGEYSPCFTTSQGAWFNDVIKTLKKFERKIKIENITSE